MSQEHPHKPSEAIKYGDVFNVSGQLASQPITPRDAAMLQAAENVILGRTPKGGPAAVMQSAADKNEQHGVVSHSDMTTAVKDQGATVAEADIGGYHILTESIGGQVLGLYGQPTEMKITDPAPAVDADPITIGEALEATALTAGDKPVDYSDAAAIQAAEVRATRLGHIVHGGIAAEAQHAAAHNLRASKDREKIRLREVLTDATVKLTEDKPVTREDAEGVIYAEVRNNADLATYPGGVAASVAAAARLNKEK